MEDNSKPAENMEVDNIDEPKKSTDEQPAKKKVSTERSYSREEELEDEIIILKKYIKFLENHIATILDDKSTKRSSRRV